MSDQEYTRRTLLRRGGATVGATTLATTAGCLDRIPNPFSDSYTAWLPEPDVFEQETYWFGRYDNEAWVEHEDEFSDDYNLDDIEDGWEPLSVDVEDVGVSLYFAGIQAYRGDVKRDDLVGDLEDEDFTQETDTNGYSVYLSGDESRAFAVGDKWFLFTNDVYSAEKSPDDALTHVIGTKAGDENRYVDESDDFSKLVDSLNTTSAVNGQVYEDSGDDPEGGSFDGMVAKGQTATFDGGTTKREWAVVYESSDDVDTGDLETWVEAGEGEFEDIDDIEYKQSGRVGRIVGTMDTDDYV